MFSHLLIALTALQANRKYVTRDGLLKERASRQSARGKTAAGLVQAQTGQGNSEVLPKVKYIDILFTYSYGLL